jgi:hypothetical protein
MRLQLAVAAQLLLRELIKAIMVLALYFPLLRQAEAVVAQVVLLVRQQLMVHLAVLVEVLLMVLPVAREILQQLHPPKVAMEATALPVVHNSEEVAGEVRRLLVPMALHQKVVTEGQEQHLL